MMIRIQPLPLLLAAAALAACGTGGPQELVATTPTARIKFFNFGVNAPAVNFYANDAKITAVSSSACTPVSDTTCLSRGIESTTGTTSGSAAAGGLYTGITPGQYAFSGRIAAATNKGVSIANVSATLANGKSYSYYVSGIYNTTAMTADAFAVEDNYPQQVSSDTTYLRFVNAISNAGPLTLYVRNPTTLVETQASAPIAYKGAGGFIAFPGLGAVDLVVRAAGSTAPVVTLSGTSYSPGRVYTITARGDVTVTSSTAATRPQLDNTPNL